MLAEGSFYIASFAVLILYLFHADHLSATATRIICLAGWTVAYWAVMVSTAVDHPFRWGRPYPAIGHFLGMLMCMTVLGAGSLALWGMFGRTTWITRIGFGIVSGGAIVVLGPYMLLALVVIITGDGP